MPSAGKRGWCEAQKILLAGPMGKFPNFVGNFFADTRIVAKG